MLKKIRVSMVIPNWNGAPLLFKNLPKAILAKKNPKNKIVEIVVVDDGSTDNSVDIINKNFSTDVKLVRHSTNRSFPVAVNTGVRFALGTHVCLLNTDVVPSENFLANSVKLLEDPRVFGVTLHEAGYGPAIGYFDGYLRHSNGPEADMVVETLWISGGSGVFSKRIWKELKGMDASLMNPFYWEDVDLGYRAHKRGYKLLWDPKAHVVHDHESVINLSNFRRRYLNLVKERNELLFIWKNITSENFFKKHKIALFNRVKRHPGYLRVVMTALIRWQLAAKRRKREKENSVVSDEVIFAKFSQ
jgi:GT2 family glycosyltransferase